MALPSFSYPISRKYPYKWFTYFVIIGGICATILFSVLNLAAAGYVLDVNYTFNYNETMAAKRWTRRFPFSLVDKSVTTCQSQVIPVNQQFLTNNSALQYTLTGVGNVNGTLPALEYTNNFLEKCSVAFIEIDLESTQRTAAQQGWTPWGPKAFAQISCLINNAKVPTSINVTVGYELVTSTIETGAVFSFVQPPSNRTDASLWWGQSLLSWYWLNLASAMTSHQDADQLTITQGSIIFRTPNSDDMTDLDFFSGIDYRFTVVNATGKPGCCLNPGNTGYNSTLSNLAAHEQAPNVWVEADSLAKAFYATIMADLGQHSSVNMLANSSALEHFSANLADTVSGWQGTSVIFSWLATNPATQKYSEVRDTTGPLSISPSIISKQYLCQIPKLKSGGSLFVSILVADLVFLQALWKILNWIMVWRLGRSDYRANFCEGCKARDAGVELLERPSTMTTQYDPMLEPVLEYRPHLRGRQAKTMSIDSREQLLSPS